MGSDLVLYQTWGLNARPPRRCCLTQIPVSFDSLEHYLAIQLPLVYEEATESVRSTYEEARDNDRGSWAVNLIRHVPQSLRSGCCLPGSDHP